MSENPRGRDRAPLFRTAGGGTAAAAAAAAAAAVGFGEGGAGLRKAASPVSVREPDEPTCSPPPPPPSPLHPPPHPPHPRRKPRTGKPAAGDRKGKEQVRAPARRSRCEDRTREENDTKQNGRVGLDWVA